MEKRRWYLYVLELENGCYYIGIDLDVERRFASGGCRLSRPASHATCQRLPGGFFSTRAKAAAISSLGIHAIVL